MEDAASSRQILEGVRARGLRIGWGKGRLDGSFTPEFNHRGTPYKFFRFYTNGSVEILFEYLCYQPPFDDESLRLELLRRLNEMTGVNIPADKITKHPTIPLGLLKDDDVMEQLLLELWTGLSTR